MRSCKKCGTFFDHRKCPKCQAARNAAYYAAHREEAKAYSKAWHAAHRKYAKARAAAYYATHREEAKIVRAKWKASHPDMIKRSAAKYRKVHRDQIAVTISRWHKAHPEKSREACRRYIKTHRDRCKERRYRRRAWKAQGILPDELSPTFISDLFSLYGNRCTYEPVRHCSPGKLTVDHIIPLSRGGRHTPRNLAPACLSCNCAKKNKTPEEWRMVLGISRTKFKRLFLANIHGDCTQEGSTIN